MSLIREKGARVEVRVRFSAIIVSRRDCLNWCCGEVKNENTDYRGIYKIYFFHYPIFFQIAGFSAVMIMCTTRQCHGNLAIASAVDVLHSHVITLDARGLIARQRRAILSFPKRKKLLHPGYIMS